MMMDLFEELLGAAGSVLIFAAPLAVIAYVIWAWFKQPAGADAKGWMLRIARGAVILSAGLGLFLEYAGVSGAQWSERFLSGGVSTLPIIRAGAYLGIGAIAISIAARRPGRWKVAAAAVVMFFYWFTVATLQ